MPQLRINLIPAYIGERKKTQAAIVIFTVLFIASVVVPIAWWQKVSNDVKVATQKGDDLQAVKTEIDGLKTKATSIRAGIAPIVEKVTFVKDIQFYNGWRQKIYRQAANYTIGAVEYNSMAITGDSISMSAYANSQQDLLRYYIAFYGNPDVTAVSVSGPPGWTPESQAPVVLGQPKPRGGFPFSVNAKLLRGLQLPTIPASLNSPPGGAATGAATPNGVTANPDDPDNPNQQRD